MNLKCLKLEHWMDKSSDFFPETIKGYKKIKPKVRKNGLYCLGNDSWFEIDGQAWEYDKKTFDYTLNLIEARKYNKRTFESLKELVEQKIATEKQTDLFFTIETLHFIHFCEQQRFKLKKLIKKRAKNE